ncbi:Gamma-tubulin complex component 2 [Orobanche gracilis]
MDSIVPSPSTPKWNVDRPFLTGRFHQEMKSASGIAESKGVSIESSSSRVEQAIGCYHVALQELIVIDDLLSAMVGIEGRYVSIRRVRGIWHFQVDASMDLALQESAKRMFPLCENYLHINQFVELKSQFKSGLVNHAFAAALRTLLLDYQATVAQLEHQFRLGKLSVQGLWFYCQPMMGSMQALSILIKKASAANFIGSAVLNLLQSQAKAMAGDHVVRSLLEKMSQSANQPYLGILERWVYEGVIDDPYGEFFIAENKSLLKESLTHDYDAKYWQQRYSLKDDIPSFLANAAETILTTGKYLNVMRECGHSIQVPVAESLKLTTVGYNHRYLECINGAYDFASGELLNLIKEKYDLMGKLRSIKHYLLLDQGDFLVHFMDIALEELMKKPDEISVEKLQSLLDLALRSSAAVADPYHEDLTCCVERTSLLKRLSTLKDLQLSQIVSSSSNLEEPVSITGPMHGLRRLDMQGIAISVSSLLCRNMLKFINSLLHYLTFEVLEPNWHVMNIRLQTAKSIDEVIQYHDFFLETCLRECLLLSPVLLKKLENMKLVCLQYASAAQWLITYSNDDTPKTDTLDADRYKNLKLRTPSQTREVASENATVVESILKFEREFSSELQSLGPILSSSSRAEPYLTHLAQWLLGVGRD